MNVFAHHVLNTVKHLDPGQGAYQTLILLLFLKVAYMYQEILMRSPSVSGSEEGKVRLVGTAIRPGIPVV